MKNVGTLAIIGMVGMLILLGCATTGTSTPAKQGGHPQFTQLCAKCHTLDRVFTAHQSLSTEDMRKIVERMSQKPNSGIDPTNIDDIVKEIY